MSDDIVVRLLKIANWPFDTHPLDCSIEAVEAVDEIERLRRECDRLLALYVDACQEREMTVNHLLGRTQP